MIEYKKDLVIAKARKCFPDEDSEKIMAILNLYGREFYEQEQERVQIAILKLSEGDMETLRENVKAAKSDFRNVLAYAEYPENMSKNTWKMIDTEEIKKIRDNEIK